MSPLPADLQDLVTRVKESASARRAAEADYVYRLAQLMRASAGRRLAGGGSASAACAQARGIARTTLAAFTIVATRWTADELHALLTRRDVHGDPISVSHLLLLSRLPRGPGRPGSSASFATGSTCGG